MQRDALETNLVRAARAACTVVISRFLCCALQMVGKNKTEKKQCEKSAVHFFVSYGRWFLKKMWTGVSMKELNKKVRFY